MKKNIKQILVLTTICIMGFSSLLKAQTTYKINESKDMDMKLSGTSTLHKWSMDAKTFSGDADFNFKPGNPEQLISVKSLTFSLAVADLKSSENGLNKNAYKALKTNEYKDIDYKNLLDDPQSSIGIWRNKNEMKKLATDCGWKIEFNQMPEKFHFSHYYRYDAILIR